MQIKLAATTVFELNYDAIHGDNRFIINQGGSRSSKTYSLCQAIILYCLQNSNKTVSIVRKTFPALRATVYRDLVEVLNDMGLYNQRNHNKTEHIYQFPNGSIIELFSVDSEQKVRGRKRDICWVNEANELWEDDFVQLNMRTTEKFILDYNPSSNYSWIYDLPEDDSFFIKSTYKDNPFLEETIIRQIEDLKDKDESLYKIYALGEKAISRINVYTKWKFIKEKPDRFKKFVYGLDFGYQHPTSLVKIWYHEDERYIEEVIHQSYLTSSGLIEKMNQLGVDKSKEIVCDYARPEMIAEIQQAGYYAINANKSVQKGINAVKINYIYVDENAENIHDEYMNYKYKKIRDIVTDEPVKHLDDAMDAIRYGNLYIQESKTSSGPEVFTIKT